MNCTYCGLDYLQEENPVILIEEEEEVSTGLMARRT